MAEAGLPPVISLVARGDEEFAVPFLERPGDPIGEVIPPVAGNSLALMCRGVFLASPAAAGSVLEPVSGDDLAEVRAILSEMR